jgi:hypothetical protein
MMTLRMVRNRFVIVITGRFFFRVATRVLNTNVDVKSGYRPKRIEGWENSGSTVLNKLEFANPDPQTP